MSGHDTHEGHGWDARGPHKWHGMSPAARAARIAGMVVLGIIGAAVFALVFGWLVMILWNWLMPTIFHLGEIGYWQAFGIVILAKLIFGGLGAHRGGPGRGHGKGNPWKGNPWERGRGRNDWQWFRDFWETEGRSAFDRYAERKRGEQGAGAGPAAGPGTDSAGSGTV